MKLLDYMKSHSLSDAQVAEMIGARVSDGAVKKWKYGERVPRLPEMLRLGEITDGAVLPKDFMPDNSDSHHSREQTP